MSKKSFITGVLALLLPAVLVISVLWNYQTLADYIELLDYEPPARIAEIREDIALTSKGETLFYVHDPQIVDGPSFSSSCPVFEETIVLGCYFSNSAIYIFDVEDSRTELQGVEEVTAAHEILHAAYDRLSRDEKDIIHPLLQATYNSLADDSPIRRNIDEYAKQGEAVVLNELHSIVGTEIKSIPEELEIYYSRYFQDRQIIVSIAEDYAEVFRSLEREIDAYDTRLERLSSEITDLETDIANYQRRLERRSVELDSLRSDPVAFNAQVESYNNLVREYNAIVEEYKSTIETYNDIVKERNEISAQQTALYDAIDARTEETEE